MNDVFCAAPSLFPECVRKTQPRHIASNAGVNDFMHRLIGDLQLVGAQVFVIR